MNFYEELQKLKNDIINDSIINDSIINDSIINDSMEECLITKDILTTNYITLPCKHKFNYFPLYKTICIQKQKQSSSSLETSYLGQTEIRCPYCRTKFDKLLPYIPMKGVGTIPLVNYPISSTMEFQCCNWLKKTGINKGQMCNKPAYFDVVERSIKIEVPYCVLHWKEYEKQLKVKEQAKQEEWTKEMNDYSKKKSVSELRGILRTALKKVGGTKKELVHRIFENKLL